MSNVLFVVLGSLYEYDDSSFQEKLVPDPTAKASQEYN